MRTAFRMLGWVFAGLTATFLTRDIVDFANNGVFAPLTGGFVWHTLDSTSLQLAEAAISRYLHPYLWHPIIVELLLWPAFVLFAIPATLFFLVSRKRRRSGPRFRSD